MRARLVLAALVAIALTGEAVGAKPSRTRPGPARVVEVIDGIRASVSTTTYQHATRVRKKEGAYAFDCSGMAAWILARGAPAALAAVRRPEGGRPLAVHYYRTIARIPPGKKRGPWLHVAEPSQARPGDVIAWERPKWFRSTSTGHVAFVVEPAAPISAPVRGVLVRVADASKFRHEDDSRPVGTTGFGTGVLLLATDDAGRPSGYGWVGAATAPEWIVPTPIAIGRPLR